MQIEYLIRKDNLVVLHLIVFLEKIIERKYFSYIYYICDFYH